MADAVTFFSVGTHLLNEEFFHTFTGTVEVGTRSQLQAVVAHPLPRTLGRNAARRRLTGTR
jgi:hypothetical protein